MEDMKKKFPSLPTNYVSLQQLHEQRLKEQQQRLREKEEEEERKLQEEKLREEKFPSLPTNYVTLQQLHEQRLKEQQQRLREEEEEERKLLIQKQKEEEEKEERKHQESRKYGENKARHNRPNQNRRFLEKNHLPKKGEITLKEQISKPLREEEEEEEEERKLQEEKLKEEQLNQKQKEEEEKEERNHQESRKYGEKKAKRYLPYRNRKLLEKNRELEPKKEGEITLKEQISKQQREEDDDEERKLQEEKPREEQLIQKQKEEEEEEKEERNRQESRKYGEKKAKSNRPSRNRRLLEKNRDLEPKKGEITLKEQISKQVDDPIPTDSKNMEWRMVKKIPMMKETLEKSPPVNREKIKSPVTLIRGEGIQMEYRKRNENPPESNSVSEEKTVSMDQTVEIVQKIGDLTVDDNHNVVEKMDGEDEGYKVRSTGQIVHAAYPNVRIRGGFGYRRRPPPPEPRNSGQIWVRKEEVPEPVPTSSRFSRGGRFGTRPV